MNIFELIIIGAVQITEALINYIYAEYLFADRLSGLKKAGIYAAGYFAVYLVYIFGGNIILNCAVSFAASLLIFSAVYCCGFASALFNSAFLTALMILSEAASGAILTLPFGSFSSYTYNDLALLALAVLSKLLYMIFSMIAAKIFGPHKSESDSSVGLLRLSVMPAASASVAILICYVYTEIKLPAALQIAALICVSALLLANVFTLCIYSRSEKINRENLSIKLAKQKDEYDAGYYKMLEEQYESQRILIHDVKNHMQTINGLAAEGNAEEIQKYITEWGYDKALRNRARYCQNAILNIIVSETAKDCAKNGVEFHCDIRDKSVDFISDTDMSALFGNLLSNACEAAKESEEKTVELDIKIRPEQRLTVVKISNSCDFKPQRGKNGELTTRKPDKENHGLGQKSIRRITEKYGGKSETYYDEAEKRFETVIVFSEK